MLAALSMPASSLEYTFDSPSTGDFGTPTSYLPNSDVYLTPNLAAGGPLNSPSLTGTITGPAGQ